MNAVTAAFPEEGGRSIPMAGDDDDVEAARDACAAAFFEYLQEGLSVIPLLPGTKKPYTRLLSGGSWGVYASRLAINREVWGWVQADPLPDIGIVLGKVSGQLVAYDIEKIQFAEWLETHGRELLLEKTWTVRTGSGLLHVYIRSHSPVYSAQIEVPANWPKYDGSTKKAQRMLAEIRANARTGGASYVVAPPSTHPSGGQYADLYGSPKQIARVNNAGELFLKIAEIYKREVSTRRTVVVPGAAVADTERIPMAILPALEGIPRAELEQRLWDSTLLNRKTVRQIVRGSEFDRGDDDVLMVDHSRIDFSVCCQLRRAGFSWEEIEQVYATFPIGRFTYANPDRSNHGRRYLYQTLAAADKRGEDTQAASQAAKGLDFHLDAARLWPYDEHPYYELDIVKDDGRRATGRVSCDEMISDLTFSKAVLRSTNLVLRFRPDQIRRQDWREFVDGVSRLAETQEIGLTTLEHYQTIFLNILRSGLRETDKPRTIREVSLGWTEYNWIYFRAADLLTRAHTAGYHQLKPAHLSECIRLWAGTHSRPVLSDGRPKMIRIRVSVLDYHTADTEERKED